MTAFELVVGAILPFVTIVVLVAGLVYRIRRWRKAAVANIALFPAASPSQGEMWRKTLGEILLFSTFRKENRALWTYTWLFHGALALIILGHSRLITDWPLRVLLGMSAESVNALSAWSGGAVGIVALLTGLLLLYRRMTVQRVREITTGEDLLVMLLLIAIFVTGNALRFAHFDITVAQGYFASLFTFTSIQVPSNPMFLVHYLMVQVLLIYLPFGKLLHIPGIFFSKPLLAKDY